jgi:hypothetical protein
MALLLTIAIVLVVALVGSLPTRPHSKNSDCHPISGVSALILVLVILFLPAASECIIGPVPPSQHVGGFSEGRVLRLQRSYRTNLENFDLVKFELVSAIIGFPEIPIAECNRGD